MPPDTNESDKTPSGVVVGKIASPIRTLNVKRLVIKIFIAATVIMIIFISYKPVSSFFIRFYHEIMGEFNYRDETDTSETVTDPEATPKASNNTSTANNSNNNKSPAPTSGNSVNKTADKTYCGVEGMPKEVCDVALSIEKKGVKNNPGVTGMTDTIPDGTTFKFDFSSWMAEGKKTFYIDAVADAYGEKRSVYFTFRLIDDHWKVTSVDLN